MTSTCPRCGFAAPSGSLPLCPRCLLAEGEQAPPPASPPGLVLKEEVGRGGMGRVFRALHVRLDREVAVKFLPPELSANAAFEARFAREARALAKLSHPNIVTVFDFGTTAEGDSYIVMELVPGGALARRLPLRAEDALSTLEQVCEGLSYAHERGLVHRDIKADNVLFDGEGRAKVVDFGLARLVESLSENDAVTQPLQVLGTPGYIAPEARAGAPPDPRMDVFSAGVLLHVMITGRLPDGELRALPASLRPLVRRAIAEQPSARFASALELREALTTARSALVARRSDRAPSNAAVALQPDEQSWLRAVALTLAGATALALYAGLVSLSPRILNADDTLPFVAFGVEELPDGRVFTRARFETVPTLVAAAGWAVALGAYGLLRRHWRHAGLELTTPEEKLQGTRAVLTIAAIINTLGILRVLVGRSGDKTLGIYIPVLGGLLELVMLYLVWMTVLEAQRISRPLRREPLLWLGLALSLVPPIVGFVDMLASGRP